MSVSSIRAAIDGVQFSHELNLKAVGYYLGQAVKQRQVVPAAVVLDLVLGRFCEPTAGSIHNVRWRRLAAHIKHDTFHTFDRAKSGESYISHKMYLINSFFRWPEGCH